MIKRLYTLYDWALTNAQHPLAYVWLFVIAFTESFVSPLPPDLLLLPMMLAMRNRVWVLAALCTVSSVLGGMVGYAIGASLYEWIGKALIDFYGMGDGFMHVKDDLKNWGFWIIVGKGLTPIPFKLVTVSAGFINMPFVEFVWASLLGRALRFYMLAVVFYFMGDRARVFIHRYLPYFILFTVALLIGGVFLVKVFF